MTSKFKRRRNPKIAAQNTWHECKGCGGLIGILPQGIPGHEPPNSVCHTKPMDHVNKIPVQCPLWVRSTAEQIRALHENTPVVMPPMDYFQKLDPDEDLSDKVN